MKRDRQKDFSSTLYHLHIYLRIDSFQIEWHNKQRIRKTLPLMTTLRKMHLRFYKKAQNFAKELRISHGKVVNTLI